MKKQNIENWSLEIIENIDNGKEIEDDFVELKRKWIDPEKAARRIAGHCNAARGNDIIWLIGIDEEKGIQNFKSAEFSGWWNQVISNFSSSPPNITHLNITFNNKPVVIFHFETHNAPYVVQNPSFGKKGGGPVQREVPWRTGTSTKSAKRRNLIRLLVPVNKLPEIEFLEGEATAYIKEPETESMGHVRPEIRTEPHIKWNFNLIFYLIPKDKVVFPTHRTEFKFKIKNGNTSFIKAPVLNYYAPTKFVGRDSKIDSHTIKTTNSEAIISGPGRLKVKAEQYEPMRELKNNSSLIFELNIRPIGTEYEISKTIELPVLETTDLPYSKGNEMLKWKLNNIETESHWSFN